ncbi:acetyltransferase [Helicobacter pylori]
MAEVKLSIEEYHNVVKSLYTLIEKLYEMTKKCNDYKRQRDELINDMAEVKRKAEAWIDLKKEMIEMYPVLVIDVETTSGECEKGMLYQLGKHLRRMDKLDGTHEFRNLLSDLERGSDEQSET